MTSAMIVRTSPSVPGDRRNVDFKLEGGNVRHTRATEPVLQDVFHAENPYDTVGKVNFDCSRVSAIEVILAPMNGRIVIVHKDGNDDTGPRGVILAPEG